VDLHGFPFAKANSALGTKLDQAWLDRVRTATVRLSNCTASFVSGEGLILTNHHCVEACLRGAFVQGEEPGGRRLPREDPRRGGKRCQTQIADVLTSTEDITAKVAAAIAGKDEKERQRRAQGKLTQLEKACEDAEKLKCESVTLYTGGQYWLLQVQALYGPAHRVRTGSRHRGVRR